MSNHLHQQPEEAAASSLSPSQSSSSSNRVGYHKDDSDVQDDATDVEKSSNVHSYYYKRNDDKVKVDKDLFFSNNGGGHDDDDDDDEEDDILPNRRLQQQQQQGNRQSTTNTAKTVATATNTNTTTTQQCFNLDSIISKKARNQTLFNITRAGTKSSRSGLYIRPSWKLVLYHHLQKRYRVYIAIIVTLLLVRPLISTLVQKNKYDESSSSLSSSSSSSLSNIDDELLIDLGRDGYLKFPLEKEMGQQDESLCAVYVTDGTSSSTSSGTSTSSISTSSSSSSLSPSRPTPFQCKCINPMNAKMGFYHGWNKAHEANKNMIEEYYRSHNGSRVFDVVFLGDSITEEWNGRWLDNQQDTWKDIHEEWKRLFDPSVTLGALNGLALGIAGDSIANLLWRIKNGELEHVNSKIFWLLIGTNDLSLGCSDKTILLGILHLVQEVRKLKPDSIIVLNGLLPRTNDGEGRLGMEVGTGTNNGNVVNGHEDEMQHTATTTTATTITTTTTTTQEQRISPWQSIQSINRSLAKFAQQHDRIEYFDASDIFVGRMGTKVYHRNELFLLKELQNDFLHPTALGHKLWGEAIVDYITSDVDTPENLRRRMYR